MRRFRLERIWRFDDKTRTWLFARDSDANEMNQWLSLLRQQFPESVFTVCKHRPTHVPRKLRLT